MNKGEFFVLATKYLSKEASAKEIEHLSALLEQKRFSAQFEMISEIWEKTGHVESTPWYDVERGIKILTDKIRHDNSAFQWEKEEKRKRAFIYQPVFLRVAASFALIMILVTGALFIVNVLKQRSGPGAWNEKKTVMGEKSIVTLLDGTRITLNADSKLKYPARFGEEKREVTLEGEAYFEVTQNATKPFVVHTGNVSTTDLGTKFDVSAFPGEETITISLEEGKVNVSTNNSGAIKGGIILLPAQQLIYNKEKETWNIEYFDLQKIIGWKDNLLIFDNEPLSKVLVPLERYFGVKFEIADPSIANRLVKANFKNESLWTVMEVLKKATGLATRTIQEDHEIKKIIFYEN